MLISIALAVLSALGKCWAKRLSEPTFFIGIFLMCECVSEVFESATGTSTSWQLPLHLTLNTLTVCISNRVTQPDYPCVLSLRSTFWTIVSGSPEITSVSVFLSPYLSPSLPHSHSIPLLHE